MQCGIVLSISMFLFARRREIKLSDLITRKVSRGSKKLELRGEFQE